jgi:hypothetical protein
MEPKKTPHGTTTLARSDTYSWQILFGRVLLAYGDGGVIGYMVGGSFRCFSDSWVAASRSESMS